MRRFVTLFPEASKVHLYKSTGMIPYIMNRYFGYDSTLVSYNDISSENINFSGLKFEVLKENYLILDGIRYIVKNAKKIDVLHLYHYCKRTIIWAIVYRILNPRGIVYLKLDTTDIYHFGKSKYMTIKDRIRLKFISVFNLVSCESEEAANYYNSNFDIEVKYIPNGFYDFEKKQPLLEKQKFILTVGRIGTREKANNILLEGFAQASEKIPGWKLMVVGPIENNFESYIDNFFKINPKLKEKVIFTGPVYDRDKLDDIYAKSSIFVLSSISEGFPTVFLEAIKNGMYIITSKINIAEEFTKEGKLGKVFEINNYEQLATILEETCNEELDINIRKYNIANTAYDQYYWPNTCIKLNEYIENIISNDN